MLLLFETEITSLLIFSLTMTILALLMQLPIILLFFIFVYVQYTSLLIDVRRNTDHCTLSNLELTKESGLWHVAQNRYSRYEIRRYGASNREFHFCSAGQPNACWLRGKLTHHTISNSDGSIICRGIAMPIGKTNYAQKHSFNISISTAQKLRMTFNDLQTGVKWELTKKSQSLNTA